jgi:hypothetical protein
MEYNKGENMRKLLLTKKITNWLPEYYLAKYIWLILILLTVFAYPNHIFAADISSKKTKQNKTLAAEVSNTQSKQNGGNETIFGAFGIKFGEDITPYIKDERAGYGRQLTDDDFIYFKDLMIPVDIKEIFPNIRAQLLGLSDENNRIILIWFHGNLEGIMASCNNSNSALATRQILREKYKITKPQPQQTTWVEDYEDGNGNKIELRCSESNNFDVTYTSHLMADYIERLKAKRQKEKDDIKKSLNKGM